MSTILFLVIVVVVTALVFDFTNGFHDSSNAMATSVATGAFTPRRAVLVAAVLNVIGACLSTEVSKTISHGMFDDTVIEAAPAMIFAGRSGGSPGHGPGLPHRASDQPVLREALPQQPTGDRIIGGAVSWHL